MPGRVSSTYSSGGSSDVDRWCSVADGIASAVAVWRGWCGGDKVPMTSSGRKRERGRNSRGRGTAVLWVQCVESRRLQHDEDARAPGSAPHRGAGAPRHLLGFVACHIRRDTASTRLRTKTASHSCPWDRMN